MDHLIEEQISQDIKLIKLDTSLNTISQLIKFTAIFTLIPLT